jgi:predicted dehydrogenase
VASGEVARPPVGLCLVGCGRISRMHLPAIKELEEQGEASLIAVCDADPERARETAATFGALRSYTRTADAFADPEVEGVVLCLPHNLHAPVAIEAATAGKHVLVEKPMANAVAEADAMIAAAEANRVNLMVGQSRRFYEAIQESRRRLDEIGEVLHVVCIWATSFDAPPTGWWSSAEATGGLLIALNGSHMVDYVTWLLDRTPTRVYCETSRNKAVWEGEDEATIQMRFEGRNGAPSPMATVHLSFNARPGLHARLIIGTRGTMRIEGETDLTVNGQVVVSGPQQPSNFTLQEREFVASIREHRSPSVPGRQVRRVIETLEAARKSAREHVPVELAVPARR